MPLYELAVLVARVVGTAANHRARITVVTPEAAPLGIFGRPGCRADEGAAGSNGAFDIVTGARPLEFAAGRLRIDQR